jgi:hypothetical protein
MNVPEVTAKFLHKINIDNELRREQERLFRAEKDKFIETHLP